ncbi:DUF3861 domain-containing protein [Flavobacterium sediminis]|nr:DUF3861 domain-containing protein [Flavobacterium sediminis]
MKFDNHDDIFNLTEQTKESDRFEEFAPTFRAFMGKLKGKN